MKASTIYHYTPFNHLRNILKDGLLKTSDFERRHTKSKHDYVWFSKNPLWEETASKMILQKSGERIFLNMNMQHEAVGCARIIVQYTSDFITWAKYKHLSKLSAKMLNNMELSGIEKGANPSDWYCLPYNLPKSKWSGIELWDGISWVPYTENLFNELLEQKVLKDVATSNWDESGKIIKQFLK